MKFSIIVPIYNVEKYLPQCIDSILNQDYKDFELILVNDGSPDDSLSICRQYAETKIVKNRKQWIFYKKLLAFSFVTLIGVAICHFVPLTEITVWNWVLHAFIYALIFGVLYLILSLLLFKKDVRYLKEYILK